MVIIIIMGLCPHTNKHEGSGVLAKLCQVVGLRRQVLGGESLRLLVGRSVCRRWKKKTSFMSRDELETSSERSSVEWERLPEAHFPSLQVCTARVYDDDPHPQCSQRRYVEITQSSVPGRFGSGGSFCLKYLWFDSKAPPHEATS